MAYAIVRFGDVTLPDRVPVDDLSTGDVESTLLQSIGQTFDTYGTRARQPARHRLVHRGKYVGEITYIVDEAGNYLVDEAGNFVIAGNGDQRLQSQLDALKDKLGARDQLWRERTSDGAMQWKYFRLLAVKHLQDEERAGNVAELDCEFESAQGGGWRAASANVASRNVTSGHLFFINVQIPSHTVSDAVLRVACTSDVITGLTLVCPALGIDIAWGGSYLAAGDVLVIDPGGELPPEGAEDSYRGFTLGSEHTARGWLPLPAGAWTLTGMVTGGNATVTLTWYDQFS